MSINDEKMIEASHRESQLEEVKPRLDYAGSHAKIDPAEIKLVRKLDLYILPVLWLMYWLNFLDRNAITVARLDGLEKELKITGVQYQTCISILFVGYILGQIPSNMLITRLRPSLFMSGWMAAWAVVSALTAITHNFTGLLLTRFFLGLAEAPFWPGCLYLLNIFYTRKEVAMRVAILFSANICGTAFAGLIAIGVFEMRGIAGLSGWRWLFILQGIITFVVSAAGAFILPDEPHNTRWLSEEERVLAHDRIARETVERYDGTTTWAGLVDCLKDRKLWILLLFGHVSFAASNFKNFFPTIIATLGYNRTITLALTCPPYIIAAIASVAWSWNSGRMNERTWHITVAKVISIIGFVMAAATLNTAARYVAICLFCSGLYMQAGIGPGWVGATCGQTKEKRAVALAMTNTINTVAPIYTSYLWIDSNAPRYDIPMASSAAFSVASIALAWTLRYVLVRENRKIKQSNSEATLFYVY
ncbi:uncharacterized protein A1O9_11854 [Exophiala aquamarina CBS 119918]|uniref:Major facilitator superfamily (MFS) profile domain-containing protein n=1 Tax=Exophiala aquamarina CBS 119918 TaxID=1182545 RepID=A0A072NXT3_9EURO|nr:uncharacterized protein A1O9_11854 [Exophiala aquamarina CBS 119918]KEF52227.1 hypothetical protein A1O9_11854 [Exophiala aquamarina CBS 119918]